MSNPFDIPEDVQFMNPEEAYREGVSNGWDFGKKLALGEAAADAEEVARLLETPYNQCTNAEHSYLRYHDLARAQVPVKEILRVANWLHGRAALVGSTVPEPSDVGGDS